MKLIILDSIIIFWTVLACGCSMGKSGHATRDLYSQVHWRKTSEYKAHIDDFLISEEKSISLLRKNNITGYLPLGAINGWYAYTLPRMGGLSLSGYYVNGKTGLIEERNYEGEYVRFGEQPKCLRYNVLKTIK